MRAVIKPSPGDKLSRRRFLLVTGAALSAPTLLPSGLLGAEAPSRRITLGVVGCGGMGTGNTESFLREKDCQVVAACDVDKQHLANLVGHVNKHYQNEDCKSY